MLLSLGPHALARTAPTVRWASRARIIKQAFGTDVLREAKALNPDIVTVCRPIHMLRTDSGVEAAREVKIFYAERGGWIPDFTELWNESDEVGQNLGNGLERRLQLHREAVPVLHDAGIAVAGFSFSVGQPQPEDVRYLAENGWAGVDRLALHEYFFGPPPFDGWRALRYRRIREWAGGNIPPILITECARHV